MLGVKVPPNERDNFHKRFHRRFLLSENLPKTSRFFTRIYPQYPWHFTTLGIDCYKYHTPHAQVSRAETCGDCWRRRLHRTRVGHTFYTAKGRLLEFLDEINFILQISVLHGTPMSRADLRVKIEVQLESNDPEG